MGRLLGKFFGISFTQETPSGTINGSNAVFALANTPAGVGAVAIFLDSTLAIQGSDYTISGSQITFSTAPALGQSVTAFYVKQN